MDELAPSGIRKVNEKALAMERAGETVIHFELGRPDFDTPEYIKKACIADIEKGDVFYTSNFGTMELREAIAWKLKTQNNVDYKPSEIIVSVGLSEAVFDVMTAILDEGDEILVPNPGWLNYLNVPKLLGATPITYTLKEENQGSMNLDRTLDDEQMAMIDAAVKAKKPILAICRGMQLVNVYFGGTLIQDLENGTMHKYVPNENKLHDTVCISGTPFAIIYGDTGIVNSAHHQAVKKLGKGFKIGQVWLSGKLSPEQKKEWLEKIENDENLEIECKRTCIIEGMIHKELPIIMVQWHPELMHRDPIKGTLDQDRIFMYFASLLK